MEGKTPAFILRLALAGLIVGIMVGYFSQVPVYLLGGLLVVGAIFFQLDGKRRWYYLAAMMLFLGWWRANASWPIKPILPIDEKIIFIGFVSEAPAVTEEGINYIIKTLNKPWQNILVKAKNYPLLSYGQEVRVACRLTAVTTEYWNNKNIFSSCSYPAVEILPGLSGQPVKRFLLNTRSYLSGRLAQFIPEPESSLLAGILWGERASIPGDIKDGFRRAGVSHILAVSGYNVTTISVIFLSILIAIGFSRRPASILSLGLIFLFVLFSGAEAAVVRAGVMGSLVVMARLLGRLARPFNLLLLAGAAILLFSPRLLTDLGFQLSFLAMTGLMYLSPVFYDKLTVVPSLLNLRQVVAETLAATFTTLPWLILKTDYISLVSPVANLLVVPVIPLVMMGGLVLLPMAILLSSLTWLSYPLWLVLRYLEIVVGSLANLPLAYLAVSWWGLGLLLLLYVGVGWWLLKIKLRPV